MRHTLILLATLCAPAVQACEAAVCRVDPETLDLTRIITFEDTQATTGPGWNYDAVLVLEGASFGERFAGQILMARGDHDQIEGAALSPLTVLSGAPGQSFSIVFLSGNKVLNGYGAAGFPRREGQGEGAVAWAFDDDQSALAFELRGGEGGHARALFLRRDGSVIADLDLSPVGEHAMGFQRGGGLRDIAGVVVTNTDPQGLAIDNLRFSRPPELG